MRRCCDAGGDEMSGLKLCGPGCKEILSSRSGAGMLMKNTEGSRQGKKNGKSYQSPGCRGVVVDAGREGQEGG